MKRFEAKAVTLICYPFELLVNPPTPTCEQKSKIQEKKRGSQNIIGTGPHFKLDTQIHSYTDTKIRYKHKIRYKDTHTYMCTFTF